MEDPVIRYAHVNIYQDKNLVLSDVSFEVQPGEFIYLIGKTGAGKSTFLKTLYGELPVREGEAMVCDYNLCALRKKDIPYLRRKLGIVFQDFQLLTDRSVYDNLDFVLKATGWKVKAKREERIDEVLTEIGLAHLKNKMPYQLSGGEQQRLVIARSLLNNPPVIIADEPTGNLDPETSDEIIKLLIRINREHNTSILMATHNYQIIDKYPSKIFNFHDQSVTLEKGIYIKM
ncbi:MAG: ATP-binding cassette domain-containing protein [Chitinophagales bacterium]|nr:ATP-binding cassette domain-containing protein [Chitinophagales bacterium]MDW8420169.1 ATP-binding cassette domain-containing protein [Chitinophagales bacterium]